MEAIFFKSFFHTRKELSNYVNQVMRMSDIDVGVKFIVHERVQMEPNIGGCIHVARTYYDIEELFKGLQNAYSVSHIELWNWSHDHDSSHSVDRADTRRSKRSKLAKQNFNRKLKDQSNLSEHDLKRLRESCAPFPGPPCLNPVHGTCARRTRLLGPGGLYTIPEVDEVDTPVVGQDKENFPPSKTMGCTPADLTKKCISFRDYNDPATVYKGQCLYMGEDESKNGYGSLTCKCKRFASMRK